MRQSEGKLGHQVAIVTGAAQGMGAAIANRLAEQGVKVVVSDINQYGRIINMSSSAGRSVSTLGGVHYTTAKAGVLGLTRAMAKEVAAFGITVNAVCPGLINTEMVRSTCSVERLRGYEASFPIPRLGSPDEVAQLVCFLASAGAGYITGASVDINGGDLMM